MAARETDKADLLRYLQIAREAMLWKLEGLSEYDVRAHSPRPRPTCSASCAT